MGTSAEIKQRASALAEKTDVNSITPKEVGGIMYDLASHGENVLRNGGTLGIRKVYESVAAMEADSTNPKDFWGDPVKKGNLVVIYDGTTTGVDNNKIYAFMKPGWELATKLDAAYATKAETDAKLAKLGLVTESNSYRYYRANRNEGYGLSAIGEYYQSEDLFTLFVPCNYSQVSAIKISGIGSTVYASVSFRDIHNKNIKVEFTPTYGEYIFHVPNNTHHCFVSYYMDSKAASENLPKFEGVTLYQRGKGVAVSEMIIGEALISSGNKIVEYPDYYKSDMFYEKIQVKEEESYKIKGVNTTNSGVLYALVDKDNNVLVRANKGETDAEIIIPKGVSYLYFAASLLYPSSFERIENKWVLFDNNYVIYRGEKLREQGFFQRDSECAVSERIPLHGIKKIVAPIFPSSSLPCVAFYNKADKYISGVFNNNSDYATTPKIVDVPTGAEYMRFSLFIPWQGQTCLMTDKEIEYRETGRLTNPLVKKTSAIKEVVFNADDIEGFDISMCPTITSDSNGNMYCVAEKRATHADTGIMHIYFAKKNENGWQKKIILESSENVGRYMNPIIFYDANGVLGVANRLYIFTAKFFDINTYVSNFTNTDDADFVYIYSDNEGETWSREFSLKQYYPNDVVLFVSSPSQAVVLQNGAFAMPGYVVKSPGGNTSLFRAGIVTFSTTNGWCLKTIDGIGNNDTENECSICEYGANSVMVNVRNFVGTRAVYFTNEILDNEYRILPHKSNQTFLTYDDYGCQGSILTWKSHILLSHVDAVNVSGRQNLCVFGSYQGMTFIPLLYISMDEQIGGYANLYAANGKLYCIYESGYNRTEISVVEITQEINDAISQCRYSLLNNNTDILQAVAVRNNL